MLNRLNKRGEQMVEASIVLPIIILVIMLLVRLCTFYLECLIAQTNMHRNMLAKWDNTNSPIVKTISETREIDYANLGLAEGLIRKSVEVKGFSVCEEKFVRVGDSVEATIQK
nr:hypothetical protein [uncultured Mogibacterium sp.]